MVRTTMWRVVRIAALAAAVALASGSLAWGQSWAQYDNDNYYNGHDDAREHGYRNGYRDGQRAGQYDLERGRRFNFKNDDWEDSRGYQHWMGNKGHYKQAYREGYERAYRQAYGSYNRRDDRDRDDWR
jgi:flagellar biosynthesis/type III secretory pathway protein FliH